MKYPGHFLRNNGIFFDEFQDIIIRLQDARTFSYLEKRFYLFNNSAKQRCKGNDKKYLENQLYNHLSSGSAGVVDTPYFEYGEEAYLASKPKLFTFIHCNI